MRSSFQKRGFTLLELMVSIAILAGIALMLSRIFTESTRAIERGKDQVLLDETARVLLDVVERDISQALIRTNVAFRVHTIADSDALYFISTGVRHTTETIPRDTAPMQLYTSRTAGNSTSLVLDLNRYLILKSASGTEDPDDVSNSSDYYHSNKNDLRNDFEPVIRRGEMPKARDLFTTALSGISGNENHAALTFINVVINADRASNFNKDQTPEIDDMPRFVDVKIGLISATQLQQAMRLHSAQGNDRATEHIARCEKIYARRIFMRNTGIHPLLF